MMLRHYLFIMHICSLEIAQAMKPPLVVELPDGRFIAEAYIFGEFEGATAEWQESIANALACVFPDPVALAKKGVPYGDFRHFYECFLRGLNEVPEENLPEYKLPLVQALKQKCSAFLKVSDYDQLHAMLAAAKLQLEAEMVESSGEDESEEAASEELAGLHKEAIESLVAGAKKSGATEPAVCRELVSVVANLKQVVCDSLVPVSEFAWVMQQLSVILAVVNAPHEFSQQQLETLMASCAAMIEAMQGPIAKIDAGSLGK